ncbi:hypothetical protein D9M71_535510 [compost metagenome]
MAVHPYGQHIGAAQLLHHGIQGGFGGRGQLGGVEGEQHLAQVAEDDDLVLGRLGRGGGLGILRQRAAVVAYLGALRGVRAAVATIMHAILILVAILRVAQQAAEDRAGRRTAAGPGRAFDGPQATASQAADQAAPGPVPLVERGIASTGGGGATRQNTTDQD